MSGVAHGSAAPPTGPGMTPSAPARSGRRASMAVAIGVTAVLAAAMTGCSAVDTGTDVKSDYAQVCKDSSTNKRLPDDQCNERSSPSAAWYFLPMYHGANSHVPAVGQPLAGGETSKPAGATSKPVSDKGGTFYSTDTKAKNPTSGRGTDYSNGKTSSDGTGKSGTSRGGFGSKGGGSGS